MLTPLCSQYGPALVHVSALKSTSSGSKGKVHSRTSHEGLEGE